jgi:Cu(I)/Ag(I) efflux system membrane fusion protein
MFANLEVPAGRANPAAEVLSVPAEAVIETGARKIVIVAEPGGFRPVEVETGVEADARIEVRKGLKADDKVVLSGQFLIDSEASLKAATTRMLGAPLTQGTGKGEGK